MKEVLNNFFLEFKVENLYKLLMFTILDTNLWFYPDRMLEIITFYGLPDLSLRFDSGFFITGIWILK